MLWYLLILYCIGINQEYLLKSLVTMSRMTYFIPWAHTETALVNTNVVKNYREDLEKNEGEWP